MASQHRLKFLSIKLSGAKALRFGLIVAALHCVATVVMALLVIGWSMAILDSQHNEPIPTGLKISNSLFAVLGFPMLIPLAELALRAGNPDPINNRIYWLLPPINSAIIGVGAIALRSALMWIRRRART